MYDLFIETLEKAGIVLPTWFFVIVLVIIALIVIYKMIKKYIRPLVLHMENINEKLEKTNEIDILKEGQINEIERSIEQDEALKKEIKTLSDIVLENTQKMDVFAENRVKDRTQSFQIQKELIDAQKQISASIESIEKKIDEMKSKTDERFKKSEEKQDARVRAELKDKIGNLYRYYHSKGEITSMEFEALEDLIKAYYKVNGNGFVKNTVEPELYKWKLVDNQNKN